jgi:hypothetical protein
LRLSISSSTDSPRSSSTGTVLRGFQVSALLRGSPNFPSRALPTAASESGVV